MLSWPYSVIFLLIVPRENIFRILNVVGCVCTCICNRRAVSCRKLCVDPECVSAVQLASTHRVAVAAAVVHASFRVDDEFLKTRFHILFDEIRRTGGADARTGAGHGISRTRIAVRTHDFFDECFGLFDSFTDVFDTIRGIVVHKLRVGIVLNVARILHFETTVPQSVHYAVDSPSGLSLQPSGGQFALFCRHGYIVHVSFAGLHTGAWHVVRLYTERAVYINVGRFHDIVVNFKDVL